MAWLLGVAAGCSDSPTASVTGNPVARLGLADLAAVGIPSRFDASGSRDPRRRMLRFRFVAGDGTAEVETGRPVWYHAYRRQGTFRVCVEVRTVDGRSDSDCSNLRVGPPVDGGITPDLGVDARMDAGADGWQDIGVDVGLDVGPPPDATSDLASPDATSDLASPDATSDLASPDATSDLASPDATSDLASPDGGLLCFGSETGGLGDAGYLLKIVPACHVDISQTGTPLNLNADEQGVLTFLPFDFWFYGKLQFAVGVSSNGFLQFPGGATLTLLSPQPAPIPSSTDPDNLVAVFWDDLSPLGGLSEVYTQTLGTSPNRVHVIEWYRWTIVTDVADPVVLTFAVYLHETSNTIEMQYLELVGTTGAGAAIGIEDSSGLQGVQHSFQQQDSVSTAAGLRFVPQ